MPRVRKYLAGEPLTVGEIAEAATRGKYVMLHAKPMHPGWVTSMTLQTINCFARRGYIRAALLNPAYIEPKGTDE